jgi:hypothetical protein
LRIAGLAERHAQPVALVGIVRERQPAGLGGGGEVQRSPTPGEVPVLPVGLGGDAAVGDVAEIAADDAAFALGDLHAHRERGGAEAARTVRGVRGVGRGERGHVDVHDADDRELP